MKARIVAVGVLLVVVVVIAWNAILFGPAGDKLDTAKARNATAQQAKTQLEAQLKSLRDIANHGPEFQAKIEKYNNAIPVKADLEGFIRTADDLKLKAGVDWVSIQPAAPAGGNGPSEIRMQIVISGGFYQVLDYLNRLEGIPRIVVIDGINVTTGSDSASSNNASAGNASTPTTQHNSNGAPNLSVSLTARMFTQAVPTGTGSTPNARPGVTPTTAALGTTGSTVSVPTPTSGGTN